MSLKNRKEWLNDVSPKTKEKCRDIHRGLSNVISAGSKRTVSSVIDDEGEHPA
jgi:hypothetical protein